MIEVEDKDPEDPCDFRVAVARDVNPQYAANNVQLLQEDFLGAVYIHIDTWPALKAAIEQTFEEMGLEPLIPEKSTPKVYALLRELGYSVPETEEVVRVLRRGGM